MELIKMMKISDIGSEVILKPPLLKQINNKIMRTDKERKRDTKVLNIIKAICIFIMMMYCFFNEFLLNHIGGLICILAISFMIVPRQHINHLLETLDDDD